MAQAMFGDNSKKCSSIDTCRSGRWMLPVATCAMLLCWSAPNDVLATTVADVRFPTNVVPNTVNDRPIELSALLYLPDKQDRPVPAVVITPSSGGVRPFREIYYAQALAAAGIAAPGGRQLFFARHRQFGTRSTPLTRWQIGNDAVAGRVGSAVTSTEGSADRHRGLAAPLQYCSPTLIVGLSTAGTRGVRPRPRRVAVCATPTSSGCHALSGAQTNDELTFQPDHSMGAGHTVLSLSAIRTRWHDHRAVVTIRAVRVVLTANPAGSN